MKPPNLKTCIICKNDFKPFLSTHRACSVQCSVTYAKSQAIKQDKAEKKVERQKKREGLEKLKTTSDHLQQLQRIFNTFIRLRDIEAGYGCISCDIGKVEQAGHLFTTSNNPNLRFNEFNTNGQCIACNMHKSGNVSEYMIRLTKRIGQDNFESILLKRNKALKLNLVEIEELKNQYREKIRALKASS